MPQEWQISFGITDVLEIGLFFSLILVPFFYLPDWRLPTESSVFAFHLVQAALNVTVFPYSGYWALITFGWDATLLATQYLIYQGYFAAPYYNLDKPTDDKFKEFTKLGLLGLGLFITFLRFAGLFCVSNLKERERIIEEYRREALYARQQQQLQHQHQSPQMGTKGEMGRRKAQSPPSIIINCPPSQPSYAPPPQYYTGQPMMMGPQGHNNNGQRMMQYPGY